MMPATLTPTVVPTIRQTAVPDLPCEEELYLLTQERAWLTGEVTFALSDGGPLVLVVADKYHPQPGQQIVWVAWPPRWQYRRRNGRLAWLQEWGR